MFEFKFRFGLYMYADGIYYHYVFCHSLKAATHTSELVGNPGHELVAN